MIRLWILGLVCLLLLGCKSKAQTTAESQNNFSADSAYAYIAHQVAFGPRVPGTSAHQACGDWLMAELSRHGVQVKEQMGTMLDYAQNKQAIRNIVAYFEGTTPMTIMLCAHWDCRPWSDEEMEYSQRFEPVPGANDGASGVGVILEILRQLSELKKEGQLVPNIQVVFFDCEDMGTPSHYTGQQREDTWCLGSQLWAKEYKQAITRAHSTQPKIHYGILLDMVGDASATFPLEYFSMTYAGGYVERVWRTAVKLGYGRYFTYQQAYPITDDHYYVNTIASIPCIDIIDYKVGTETGFSEWWHTQQDDMQNINKSTLQAVGETVLTTICSK